MYNEDFFSSQVDNIKGYLPIPDRKPTINQSNFNLQVGRINPIIVPILHKAIYIQCNKFQFYTGL